MFGNLGEAASLAGANFRNFRKRYANQGASTK
jgi:hypothetical protein